MEYFAVIFTSVRSKFDEAGYADMSDKMAETAKDQPGFIDMESVRDERGNGITVSYWDSLDAIKKWRAHSEHLIAQKMGREKWYQSFKVRISKVEREYEFSSS